MINEVVARVRPYVADDHQFVLSGWSTSYRPSRDISFIPAEWHAEIFHRVIEYHLARVRTLVAHGETGTLFGFVAYDPRTYVAKLGDRDVTLDGHVYYVYVAEPFRRHRVAHRLFAAAGISPAQRFGYAARTRWTWMLRDRIPRAEYDSMHSRYA